MRFNTIGVSDGISMGTDGMSYSLQSRDLIADSIETVMCAQWYDACIVLPGCDKNMPGSLMALGRLNRPGFMIYGGTIRAGHTATGEPIDIVSAFTCYGAQMMGKMTDAERARSRPPRLSRRRRVRRHVHGQHDGHRPSKRWAWRCRTARRSRPPIPASSTSAAARARRFAIAWRRTSSRATS